MPRDAVDTDSLGSLVQAYVEVQCGVILQARGSIPARDEDVVHPVRVAIRRLRATLSTFGAVYDADLRASFAKELRWAGVLLGDVRDLQVLAARFETEGASTAAAEQVIAGRIARDRIAAWQDVIAGLSSARGTALFAEVARWQDDPPFAAAAERPATRARKKVGKADDRVRAILRRARAASDAGDAAAALLVHDARKAAKRHRYAVELAQPVLGANAGGTIERRQALQDALGEHQDAVVALAYLRRIDLGAEDPATARAVQELIARTRERADDIAGALREAKRLRG